jgi:hypothetical protein
MAKAGRLIIKGFRALTSCTGSGFGIMTTPTVRILATGGFILCNCWKLYYEWREWIFLGDELLFGKNVDTNSAWLAQQCLDCGFAVDELRVLGDVQKQLVDFFRTAKEDGTALVLMTGGLGPTEDDRTRHAVAEAMGGMYNSIFDILWK